MKIGGGLSMNDIHPTAIIEEGAILGDENVVGPYVIIEKTVIIGDNNVIGAGCQFINNVVIGDNNTFGTHVVIGGNGEIRGATIYGGWVIIENDNIINHHVTIDRPITESTTIGTDTYIMTKSHIAHDCIIEDKVTMATGVILGGYSTLLEGCNLGLGVVTHQFSTIGQYAMVGMNTTITKDISPFMKVVGSPPRYIGLNDSKLYILGCVGDIEETLTTIVRSEYYGLFLVHGNRRGKVLDYPL